MPEPRVSIVTPSFNQGQFIEETITSVLDQGYPNLEYIIIDGGSSDNTVEIVKKYANHLKYWVSEPDRGQSDAINKGLLKCTGEIFNWLNSDDILLPDTLSILAERFECGETDIVSGTEIYFHGDREERKLGTILYQDLEETIFHGVIYQPSTYWRLPVLRSLLPLQTNLHYLMDADLWMRYLLLYGQRKVVKINDPLVKFRLHENSKTMSAESKFLEQRWFLRKSLYEKIRGHNGKWTPYLKPLVGDIQEFAPFEITQNIKQSRILRLLAEELTYHYYLKFDYNSSKKILYDAIFGESLMSSRLLGYFLRLFLFPKNLLNALRK